MKTHFTCILVIVVLSMLLNFINIPASAKKTLPALVDKEYDDKCEGIRCGRGRCIPLIHMCDGVRECEDGNDESESACDKKHTMCSIDPYHKGCGKLSQFDIYFTYYKDEYIHTNHLVYPNTLSRGYRTQMLRYCHF